MPSHFKSEKEWNAFLAKNPQVAGRIAEMPMAARPVAAASPIALATSNGVSIARPAKLKRSLEERSPAIMAWVFLVQVIVSTFGAFGCVCGMMALRYLNW